MAPITTPVPPDFAEVALHLSLADIGKHYGWSQFVSMRVKKLMSPEWQAQWNAQRRVARHIQASAIVSVALAARVKKRNTIAPGFVDALMTKAQHVVATEFRMSPTTVTRLLKTLPEDVQHAIKLASLQRRTDFAESTRSVTKARENALRAERMAATAAKRAAAKAERDAALSLAKADRKFKRRSGPSAWTPNVSPQYPTGAAYQAIQALQRAGYRPVYDVGKVSGIKAMAGVYAVGNMRVTAGEMFEMAKKVGWRVDEWKEVRA